MWQGQQRIKRLCSTGIQWSPSVVDNPPTVKKKQPAAGKLEEKLPSAVPNVKSPSGPPEDIELVGHEGSRT